MRFRKKIDLLKAGPVYLWFALEGNFVSVRLGLLAPGNRRQSGLVIPRGPHRQAGCWLEFPKSIILTRELTTRHRRQRSKS
jgi:hypothetical protein